MRGTPALHPGSDHLIEGYALLRGGDAASLAGGAAVDVSGNGVFDLGGGDDVQGALNVGDARVRGCKELFARPPTDLVERPDFGSGQGVADSCGHVVIDQVPQAVDHVEYLRRLRGGVFVAVRYPETGRKLRGDGLKAWGPRMMLDGRLSRCGLRHETHAPDMYLMIYPSAGQASDVVRP